MNEDESYRNKICALAGDRDAALVYLHRVMMWQQIENEMMAMSDLDASKIMQSQKEVRITTPHIEQEGGE